MRPISGPTLLRLSNLLRYCRDILKRHSFLLKEMESTQPVMGNVTKPLEPSALLGMVWNRMADTVQPNWKLNLHTKLKGSHQGPDLTLDNINKAKLSRRTFVRFLAELYDPTGLFAGHFSMTLKANLKKICKLFSTKKGEYDAEIKTKDIDLHNTTVKNIQKVLNFSPSIDRCIARQGSNVSSLPTAASKAAPPRST